MSIPRADVDQIVKIIAAQERQPCSHPVIQANAARGIFQRFMSTYDLGDAEKAKLREVYKNTVDHGG